MRTDPPPGPAPFGVAPPTGAPGPAAAWTAEAGGGAHPCPRGTSGSANQQAPCWPTGLPRPAPCREPLLSRSKMAGCRRRGPRARVRPLLCALLLSLSHFVRGDGGGGHPGAAGAAGTPAALPHRRFEYKYSFKGPHLVQSDGTVPFWAHAGSKPGPRAGGRVPPRLAPPSLRLLSAAHLVRGERDPLGCPSCRSALGPGSLHLPPRFPRAAPRPHPAGLLLDLVGSFRVFGESFVTYPPERSPTLASGHHVSP